MADIRTIYTVDVRGDFEKQLRAMSAGMKSARGDWNALRQTFIQNGASLRKTRQELKALGLAEDEAAIASNKRLTATRRLISGERALAKAYNNLVSQQNKLTISRLQSLQVLEQEASQNAPRIVQARAEAAALRKIETALVQLEEARILQTLAAQKGLKVSADGTRIFDAEAEAMRRAGKAADELAVKKLLAAKGLDTTGAPAKPGPLQGPTLRKGLTLEDERLAQEKAYEDFRKKALATRVKDIQAEKGLIASRSKEINTAGKTAADASPPFSRLLFTFRRLIGVMAAFTIARKVTAGFTGLIAEAIRFNAAIESTRVGLAGLIAASAEIRSLDGQRLSVADQIRASSNIAIDQMSKLRTAALQTAASYEEIATAFTQAVAPGLRAGLNLDQIRQVTVEISQAATGLGVAQSQLSEEIRSLFQGTINPRNTRIATALGISSADIRRAKELGTLFSFLQNRFAAISATGKELMNTFTGQLSNAKDALSQILAETSKPLFEQLKQGLKEVQSAIFSTINDQTVFKPEALRAFQGLFEGLANGVRGIRTAFGSIDIKGFADSFGFVGEALGTAATVLANAFSTFFNVAAPAITLLKNVFRVITSIAVGVSRADDFFGGWVKSIVLTFGKLLLLTFTLKKVWAYASGIGTAFRAFLRVSLLSKAAIEGLVGPLSKATKLAILLRNNFVKLVLPILLAASALVALTKLFPEVDKAVGNALDTLGGMLSVFDDMLDRVLGLRTSLESIDNTIKGSLVDDFRDIVSQIDEATLSIDKNRKELERASSIRVKVAGLSTDIGSQIREFLDEISRGEQALEEAVRARDLAQTSYKNSLQESSRLEAERSIAQKRFTQSILDTEEATKKLVSLTQKRKDIEFKIFLSGEGFDQISTLRKEAAAIGEEEQAQQKKIKTLEEERKTLGQTFMTIRNKLLDSSYQQGALEENLISLDKKLLEARKNTAEAASVAVEASIEEYNVRTKLASISALASTQNELQLNAARISGAREEIALAEALASKRRAAVDLLENEIQFSRDKGALLDQINSLEQYGGEQGLKAAQAVRQQLTSLEDIHELDKARLQSILKLASEEERIAKIRNSGSFGDGLTLGLQEWKKEVGTLATVGEDFAKNLNEGLATFAGQSFRGALAAALDPNQNFDLAAAITNLGLDLAAGLVEDLARQLLASLISIPVDTAGATASAAILTGAGATLSTSMVAGATTASILLNAAALNLMLAMSGSNTSTLFKGIGAASQIVGSVSAVARGGRIYQGRPAGYATGGSVHGIRRPDRGIDPRDTVPAFLRPGEWVIRPEAVQRYGHRVMSLLNGRRLNPDLVRALAAAPRSAPSEPAKRSFATGGPVQATSASGSSPRPSVVAQFFDEQVMDRAFAAGPNATMQFVRRKRRAYRNALSLED